MAGLAFANQSGAPDGLNQALPANGLPDTFVRWSQDALFDRIGTIRRRGPFTLVEPYDSTKTTISQPTPTSSTDEERPLGLISTANLLGENVMAFIVYNSTNQVKFYGYTADYVNTGTSTLRTFASTDADYSGASDSIFSSSPALGGGVWFSLINDYSPASITNNQCLYYWRGGIGTETATAGIAATYGYTGAGVNSTYTSAITCSITGVTSGMFAFDVVGGEDYYLGIVKSVSGGVVTLEKNILRTALGAADNAAANSASRTVRFTNTRPYIRNHGRGLLTVNTALTTITSGNEGGSAEGHWQTAGLNSSWVLYRASDHMWIGNIATITNNASGTLSATYVNTAITAGLTNEQYVAYPISYSMSANANAIVGNRTTENFTGVFTATYQGYQWYANCGVSGKGNRIVFSATHNPESVDLSREAPDSIELSGTNSIRGIASTSAGLLIFTDNKTYIIRGNSRFNFSLEELYPEGVLCASSIVEYGGGAFWVSKNGFMVYDGGSVRNLTKDNLGSFYTDSVKSFDAKNDKVYSCFYKNYLFVYFTKFQSSFIARRYEPTYVTNWTATSGIQDLIWSNLDDAFVWADFSNDSKTPVYWDSQDMYKTIGAEAQGIGATYNTATYGLDDNGIYKYGPLNFTDGMMFALYLPSGSVTTFSNIDFSAATTFQTSNGISGIMGVTADITDTIRARMIGIDSIIDVNTTGRDPILAYNNIKTDALYRKGPDFFLQTKAYTVGDPILKKWFQRILFNMKLNDGAIRLDIVDDEDNESINIGLKTHKGWEVFTPRGYKWSYVISVMFPKYTTANTSTWLNVEDQGESWVSLLDPEFERYKKRFSWRNTSAGFRIYQLNDYETPYSTDGRINIPDTVEINSWNIGYKPMRDGRQ